MRVRHQRVVGLPRPGLVHVGAHSLASPPGGALRHISEGRVVRLARQSGHTSLPPDKCVRPKSFAR
eukprot:8811162-Pyramimonas_sp.AAC.1